MAWEGANWDRRRRRGFYNPASGVELSVFEDSLSG